MEYIDYTTADLEEIFGVNISKGEAAQTEGRALGSPTSDAKFYSVTEVTLNMPQTKRYLSLSYLEQVDINKHIFLELCDSFGDNLVENMYYIENTCRGQPHLHGYIRTRHTEPIIPAGMLMDMAKLALKNLTKVQYERQCVQSNYNPYLLRFRSPALCLNYKSLLHDKWLTYIKKNAPKI